MGKIDRGSGDSVHDQPDDAVQQQHCEAEDRCDEQPGPDLAAAPQVGELVAGITSATLPDAVDDQRRCSAGRADLA